jgi:hypothetical protein
LKKAKGNKPFVVDLVDDKEEDEEPKKNKTKSSSSKRKAKAPSKKNPLPATISFSFLPSLLTSSMNSNIPPLDGKTVILGRDVQEKD